MRQDALFGELRSLLDQEPSQELWTSLCELMPQWEPERFEHEVLPYVLSRTSGWPIWLTTAPLRWIEAGAQGEFVPWLQVCRTLRFGYDERPPDLASLLANPALDQVVFFDLYQLLNTGSGPGAGIETILAAGISERARGLQLGGNHLNDGHIVTLLRGANWSNLEYLTIRWEKGVGADTARAVATDPQLAGLRSLTIEFCALGDEGARALAASPHLARVTSLSLTSNGFTDEAAFALASSPLLQGVEYLDISRSEITDEGMSELVRQGGLHSLRKLLLGMSKIGREGFAAAVNLPALETFWASRAPIGDEGLKALLDSRLMPTLEELNLWDNRITAAGVEELARRGPWPRLRVVSLTDNQIGTAGVDALVRHDPFPSLAELSLTGIALQDEAACVLASWSRLRQLERLSFDGHHLSPDALQALIEGLLPNPSLRRLSFLTNDEAGARAMIEKAGGVSSGCELTVNQRTP